MRVKVELLSCDLITITTALHTDIERMRQLAKELEMLEPLLAETYRDRAHQTAQTLGRFSLGWSKL